MLDFSPILYSLLKSYSEGKESGSDKNTITQNVSLEVDTGITEAVEKAGDAVVGITNIQSSSFWLQEGGNQEAGTGSGVIYKKAGDKAYIVTNNHVIEGADQLEVTLADGTKIPARRLEPILGLI